MRQMEQLVVRFFFILNENAAIFVRSMNFQQEITFRFKQ